MRQLNATRIDGMLVNDDAGDFPVLPDDDRHIMARGLFDLRFGRQRLHREKSFRALMHFYLKEADACLEALRQRGRSVVAGPYDGLEANTRLLARQRDCAHGNIGFVHDRAICLDCQATTINPLTA